MAAGPALARHHAVLRGEGDLSTAVDTGRLTFRFSDGNTVPLPGTLLLVALARRRR